MKTPKFNFQWISMYNYELETQSKVTQNILWFHDLWCALTTDLYLESPASNFISALKVLYGLWCHETLLPDLCVWWMWELLLSLSDQDYEQSTATHCVHRVYR